MLNHNLRKNFKYFTHHLYQRGNAYYKYNYNSKIEELINKQIQAEQQAAQDYLSMSVHFLHPSKSELGAGGYFMKMYHEEIEHMQEFIHYQIMRGGKICICGLETPKTHTDLSLCNAFCQALDMEKTIMKRIEELVAVAEDVNDHHCADFLRFFINEQMQSIYDMSMHTSKLKKISDIKHALYNYDLELAKLHPYSLKTK